MNSSPMVGFLIGTLAALLCASFGARIVVRCAPELPFAARAGVGGLIGIGLFGLVTFLLGIFGVPSFHLVALGLIAVVGLASFRSLIPERRTQEKLPNYWLILPGAIGLLLLFRLIFALSPSDANDWDSISHQMAMSKIWLEAGRISWIPFMDHSNIPSAINSAYVPMLALGGQFACKTLIWWCAVFAIWSVAGVCSFVYGKKAGVWAAIALACIPVFIWEAGSAYIDIPNGAFAGLSLLFAGLWLRDSDRKWITLSAVCFGLAMASKYTAFQYGAALVASLLVFGALSKSFAKSAATAGAVIAIGLLFAAPFLIRNVVNTGNPVYPFFYSVFGGRNWNAEYEQAYKMEQSRFGVGKEPEKIAGSVTALALDPGRQINNGAVWGAVGPMFVFGFIAWAFTRRTRFESGAMLMCALTLLSWFFLTQQSRYIIGLLFPVAVLVGGLVSRDSWLAKLIIAGVVAQFAYSLYLFGPAVMPLGDQAKVLAGTQTEAEFLKSRFAFYDTCEYVNELGKRESVKLAMFDEVRGFYLNVPYLWANPGHHTLIDYPNVVTSEQLVAALKQLDVTHIYLNCRRDVISPELAEQMKSAMGTEGVTLPEKWRTLLTDAVRNRLLTLEEGWAGPPDTYLFRITP